MKDESRRGLGLGRRHQRARNRDAYVAAVLSEQRRQRAMGVRDPELIAALARKVSRRDTEYAHYLAKMYFERRGRGRQRGDLRLYKGIGNNVI